MLQGTRTETNQWMTKLQFQCNLVELPHKQ
jgi:hypothetical protein